MLFRSQKSRTSTESELLAELGIEVDTSEQQSSAVEPAKKPRTIAEARAALAAKEAAQQMPNETQRAELEDPEDAIAESATLAEMANGGAVAAPAPEPITSDGFLVQQAQALNNKSMPAPEPKPEPVSELAMQAVAVPTEPEPANDAPSRLSLQRWKLIRHCMNWPIS